MKQDFRDRVVMITGAGSGIGRQLAIVLAREGAKIGAIDISLEGLDSLERQLQTSRMAKATGDVTDRNSIEKAVSSLEARLGPTDIMIANAGIGRETPAICLDADLVNKHFRVNLEGVINSISAVLPGMIQRKSGQLVALSSLASYYGLPVMSAYCASKAAVSSMMDSFRVELRSSGILCTTICPGWIDTPLTRSDKLSKLKKMSLEKAVDQMVAIIRNRKDYAAFPKGSNLFLLWLLRQMPKSVNDWLVGRAFKRLVR